MAFRLLLATGNAGKLRELRRMLAELDVELLGLRDLPAMDAPVEDGDSFADNALIKARYYAERSGLAVLSDDSGLEVDALAGAPGVHSSRYAGDDASDAHNCAKLVRALANTPDADRGARYRVVLAFLDPIRSPRAHTLEGSCEGQIARQPAGEGGFGYDPYFIPAGHTRHMAQLSPDEKNALSHRGQAVRAFVSFLQAYLARPSA